ncbi:unnamed protein product [Camellia sinensis]
MDSTKRGRTRHKEGEDGKKSFQGLFTYNQQIKKGGKGVKGGGRRLEVEAPPSPAQAEPRKKP